MTLRPDRLRKLRFLAGDRVLEIAVRIWGDEQPKGTLFCLHGFAGTGQDFGFLGAALREEGIMTVALDMPGRGMSSFLGDARHYGLKLIQGALQEAVKLAQGPLVVAGTSWGGVIAATMAANAPSGVTGLVLVDTPLVSNDPGDHPHEDFIRDEARSQFSTLQSARIYFAATRNLQHVPADALDEMVLAAIMPWQGGFRMRYDPALMGVLGRRGPFDLTKSLGRAAFPILAVLGRHSHLAASAKQDAARKGLGALTIHHCDGEAHPPSLSRAADLGAIRSFVTECVSRGV